MITVTWDDADKRLLCTTFQKPWTWEEWDSASKVISAQLATVNHQVYMVQDIRTAGFPPNGGVWRFRQITSSMDTKVERVIFIGMAGFIQNLIETLQRISFGYVSKDRFTFVSNIDEARALLLRLPGVAETLELASERVPTLPDTPMDEQKTIPLPTVAA